jgi:hypothetical protein
MSPERRARTVQFTRRLPATIHESSGNGSKRQMQPERLSATSEDRLLKLERLLSAGAD